MCFSDMNWIKSTKKRAKRCNKAQKIKLAILTIWKNQEKSPELSSARNKKLQNLTIPFIQTHNDNQSTHRLCKSKMNIHINIGLNGIL